jgi:hypothetical protein
VAVTPLGGLDLLIAVALPTHSSSFSQRQESMIASLSNYQGLHCVTESIGGRDTEEGQSEEEGQEGQGEGEALLMHVRTAEDKVKDIKYIKSLSARAVARKSAAIKVLAGR